MARPHVAAALHDAWNRRVSGTLRERGWGHRIIPHLGYGSPISVRVLGRMVMSRRAPDVPPGSAAPALTQPEPAPALLEPTPPLRAAVRRDEAAEARWWRDFVGAPAMHVPVRVTLRDRVIDTTTDGSGLIDVTIRGHGFPPGRHRVRLSSTHAHDVDAEVLIIGTTQRIGVISDIDDTVLSTMLPRPLIAAWNTFVREEGARQAVPGMATLYRRIAQRHPGIPFVYLSTGSWNIAPNLRRFLHRHGYPIGPMLLTDWGPTNTGWFRSGQQHKRSSLRRLARDFPHITWVLIGDDGQHDPKLYAEFAAARPEAVCAIAIRQLSVGEQVLSHGLPVANDELVPAPTEDLTVPVVRAPDGYALGRALSPILGLDQPSEPRLPEFGDEDEDGDDSGLYGDDVSDDDAAGGRGSRHA